MAKTSGSRTATSGSTGTPRSGPSPDGPSPDGPSPDGPSPDGPAPSDSARVDSLPTAELIGRATEQLSTLIRNELALARLEMTEKAGHAAKGAGLLGAATAISLYGGFGILTGIVLLLARVMPDWGAALLIGALLLAIAGLMGITGRAQVGQATPPVPEAAVAGVRRDIDAVAAAVQDGRRPVHAAAEDGGHW